MDYKLPGVKRWKMFFLKIPIEGLPLILLLIAFIIWVIGLVAIANGRFYDNTTKLCWFLIALFLNVIGILLFIFWGKRQVDGGLSNNKNHQLSDK